MIIFSKSVKIDKCEEKVKKMKYLMIDFGSTFTKLTAVDSDIRDVIATAAHFTTVETDITIGYENALEELYKKLGERVHFDKVIACPVAEALKMQKDGKKSISLKMLNDDTYYVIDLPSTKKIKFLETDYTYLIKEEVLNECKARECFK